MLFRNLTSMEPLVAQSGTADKRSPATAATAHAGIAATRTAPRIPWCLPSRRGGRHDTKKSLWPHPHYLLQIREMAAEQHLMEGSSVRLMVYCLLTPIVAMVI